MSWNLHIERRFLEMGRLQRASSLSDPYKAAFSFSESFIPRLIELKEYLLHIFNNGRSSCIHIDAHYAISNVSSLPSTGDTTFDENYFVRWAHDHTKSLNGGTQMDLILDKASGAGFGSKNKYLFGRVSMKIKLVPNDSAGTVTAFYMSSETSSHDELDFEFLGNTSGQPYIVQTNVFANGKGDREQRHYLWFDPTQDFHRYSFLWNQEQIIFYIDDVPIRVYKKAMGIPFPSTQPMGIYSSLWNGDDWATRGGLVKINWDHGPFVASYKGFYVDACTGPVDKCTTAKGSWWDKSSYETTDAETRSKLKWVEDNYMIYDYCKDAKRYPKAPLECGINHS